MKDVNKLIEDIVISMVVKSILEEILEEEKPHRQWSPWKESNDKCCMGTIFSRTNGKCVEMRVKHPHGGWIKARATCHPKDEYNERYGEILAYSRLMEKVYHRVIEDVITWGEV